MTKKGSFYNLVQIEAITSRLLIEYARKTGREVEIPINIDDIVERVIELSILWVSEIEGEEQTEGGDILACVVPLLRQIQFNQTHKDLFDNTPGLYQTVLAHELGHWELHFDKSIFNQQAFMFELEKPHFKFNRSISDKFKNFGNYDNYWDERNAHRFSASILIPQRFVTSKIVDSPVTNWEHIADLSREFAVTKRMMAIRLVELGHIFIDTEDNIYLSEAEYYGQRGLPF